MIKIRLTVDENAGGFEHSIEHHNASKNELFIISALLAVLKDLMTAILGGK